MDASNERVHYYHADASPIGGYLTHPFESVLQAQGSVSLSQAGGHSEARAEAFKLDNMMHSGAVYSQATGSVAKETRNWTTMVTSTVENLNVLEVVTADRIVSRISVEHPREGYYPKVSFLGTQFENLRIGGKPITAEIDLGLLSAVPPEHKPHAAKEGDILPVETAHTLIEFPGKPWPDVQSFVTKAVAQTKSITSAKGVPDWLKNRYAWMESPEERTKKGYILCSLVNSISGAAPGTTFGHVIVVPNFGNVFLGELIVDQKSFHLTMLRIEMNSMTSGHTSVAAVNVNGRGMP